MLFFCIRFPVPVGDAQLRNHEKPPLLFPGSENGKVGFGLGDVILNQLLKFLDVMSVLPGLFGYVPGQFHLENIKPLCFFTIGLLFADAGWAAAAELYGIKRDEGLDDAIIPYSSSEDNELIYSGLVLLIICYVVHFAYSNG